MELNVRTDKFGIPDNGHDPTEAALAFLECDTSGLLVDVGRAHGVRLRTPSAFSASVLVELGCAAEAVPEACSSDAFRAVSPDGLLSIAKECTWVVVAPDMQPRDVVNGSPIHDSHLLISTSPPSSPNAFRRIVTIEFSESGASLKVLVDGTLAHELPTSSRRLMVDLRLYLIRLARDRAAPQREATPAVYLPTLKGGMTTLDEEVRHLTSLVGNRLRGFTPPLGGTADAILQIVLSGAEGQSLHRTEQARLRKIIVEHVNNRKPIPITLSFAIGVRVVNALKFRDPVQLPTFGWLFFGFFFLLLNEKVKRIYSPGVRIIVFDEATLFVPFSGLGMSEAEVEQFLSATRMFFKRLGTPVEIIPLKPEHFPEDAVLKMQAEPVDDQIYAMLCSIPAMRDSVVMDPLYEVRSRDYGAIQGRAGALWEDARELSRMVVKRLAYRKQTRLFQQLIGHIEVIDACVTDKADRIVFGVTSPALINHGMPVVRRTSDGSLKVEIVPEYRIPEKHPKARPIRIATREFGIESSETFTFYYLEE